MFTTIRKHAVAHLRYFSYVMRHKWYVFEACLKYDVPIWRALIHDWTKFLPAEWFPYVEHFYLNGNGCTGFSNGTGFMRIPGDDPIWDKAVELHISRNKHHWEYWVETIGTERYANPMPETYIREMVADWTGAGKAQGKPDIAAWYEDKKYYLTLHTQTRKRVEELLQLG